MRHLALARIGEDIITSHLGESSSFGTLHLWSSGGVPPFFLGVIYGGFAMSYENNSALQQLSMLRLG